MSTPEERRAHFCDLVDAGMSRTDARREAGICSGTASQLRPANMVRAKRGQPAWHWSSYQERLLLAVKRGELAALAKRLGRSYFAAYRHRERLLKCSDASGKAKG